LEAGETTNASSDRWHQAHNGRDPWSICVDELSSTRHLENVSKKHP